MQDCVGPVHNCLPLGTIIQTQVNIHLLFVERKKGNCFTQCTVCHRNIAPNFQMKKVRFFLRSIFLKICMQVPMASIIAYIKLKKMPRMATLNYKHSANPGRSYHRAHYREQASLLVDFPSFLSFLIVCKYNARDCISDRPRRAAAGGRALAGAFFFKFINAFTYSIGTFRQFFKKIDRRKNRTFFI